MHKVKCGGLHVRATVFLYTQRIRVDHKGDLEHARADLRICSRGWVDLNHREKIDKGEAFYESGERAVGSPSPMQTAAQIFSTYT